MTTNADNFRIHHMNGHSVNFAAPVSSNTNPIGTHELLIADSTDRQRVYSLNDLTKMTALGLYTGVLATDQAAVKAAFAGVSMQDLNCSCEPCSEVEYTPVAVDVVYLADVATATTFQPGDLLGVAYNTGGTAFEPRTLVPVASAALAIGIVEDVALNGLADNQSKVPVLLKSNVYKPAVLD